MSICLIYIKSPGSASEKCVFYEKTKDQNKRANTKINLCKNSISEEEKSTYKDLVLACYKVFTAENIIVFSQHQ